MNQIIISESKSPYFNLALEEYLLDNLTADEVIFYLWQNDNTVVIGQNQNPWKECSLSKIAADKVNLARRLSGGGAVFHDKGNLNFTFITKKPQYKLEKQLVAIKDGVKKFGLDAEFSGRNDILIDGKKFSGNAFFFRGDNCYHHGTVLIDVEMGRLADYLTPSRQKIESKGVLSVRSRVINLKQLNPEITVEKMKMSLIDSFHKYYKKGGIVIVRENDLLNNENFCLLKQKYAGWQWIYGDSPKFDIELCRRYSWGEIMLCFKIEKGIIKMTKVFTDAMDTALSGILEKSLTGIVFGKQEIREVINALIEKNDVSNAVFSDILLLLEEL